MDRTGNRRSQRPRRRRRAGQRPRPVEKNDKDACRRYRPARHLLCRRTHTRLKGSRNGRRCKPHLRPPFCQPRNGYHLHPPHARCNSQRRPIHRVRYRALALAKGHLLPRTKSRKRPRQFPTRPGMGRHYKQKLAQKRKPTNFPITPSLLKSGDKSFAEEAFSLFILERVT